MTIVLDIVTDLCSIETLLLRQNRGTNLVLVLIIPIYLICLLRAKARQKVELATLLCLSIFMIILAIVRIGGLRYHNRIDLSWNHFWFHLESCTAVTKLSATAFRSLFVSAVPKGNRAGPWVPSTGRLLGRHKRRVLDHQGSDALTTPPPSLTRGEPDPGWHCGDAVQEWNL